MTQSLQNRANIAFMINNEDVDALGLLSQNLDVDLVINLKDMGVIEAIAEVNSAIESMRAANKSKILFSFPLANNDGNPTLFQPVGQTLKEAIKQGKIIRAMPASGGGWIARIKN